MKCKDIDTLLDTHGIGSLSAAGKADVASHLEECRRCADAWLGHEALAGETPAAPRAGFYTAALAVAVTGGAETGAEDAPMTAGAGGSRRWRAALGLAAGIVVAAGLVWLALPVEDAAEHGTAPEVADDSAESPSPSFLGDTLDLGRAANLQELLDLVAQARSQNFVAGTHYELLAVPAPTTADAGQVEVCEFFMFGCIHCFAFEPVLTSWVESRADSIDFVRVPVMFNDVARLHAQAYYTAEALGVVDVIVGPFYAEIHERGQMLTSVDEIRKLFASYGVNGALFDATFDSEEVRGDLRRAEELNRLYEINATPTIGVAGKYRTSASMAGSNEALFEVVDALVEAEALMLGPPESSPCEGRNRCPDLPSWFREAAGQFRDHLPPIEPADQGAERF